MSALTKLVQFLNRNRIFKFLSSVRLAVPLMLVIIVTVAAGTVLESWYNAQYAKLAVYGTGWFFLIMVILWLNIFCAALSRFPWRKHHTGFVITHLGLLTLLIGGLITGTLGIDGSLSIPEGGSSGTVVLPNFAIVYQLQDSPSVQKVPLSQTLGEKDRSGLSGVNDQLRHLMTIEKFIPFAEVGRSYAAGATGSGDVSVSFVLKSQFFNVNEWLHSRDKAEMQMGPATLRLIAGPAPEAAPQARKKVQKSRSVASESKLVISEKASGEVLKSVPIKGAGTQLEVKGIQVKVEQLFRSAVVMENKIADNPEPGAPPNPALDLRLTKDGKSQREIVYAKFPDFSLNKEGSFGLSFRFESALGPAETMPSAGVGGGGNTLEFYVDAQNPGQVEIVLSKAGEVVGRKTMKEGEAFETPWMGMTIFVGSIVLGSVPVTDVRAVKPEPGMGLPPSAIFLRPVGATDGFWLALGESRQVEIAGRQVMIGFQNQSLDLPFQLKLDKFTKVDYPGTTTPMSYESDVTLDRDGSQHKISMNEPLKEAGYTLYQASYSLQPGSPPVTVLSVNRDPGRPVKYAGGIILSIGIITFTLMRSRLARRPA